MSALSALSQCTSTHVRVSCVSTQVFTSSTAAGRGNEMEGGIEGGTEKYGDADVHCWVGAGGGGGGALLHIRLRNWFKICCSST